VHEAVPRDDFFRRRDREGGGRGQSGVGSVRSSPPRRGVLRVPLILSPMRTSGGRLLLPPELALRIQRRTAKGPRLVVRAGLPSGWKKLVDGDYTEGARSKQSIRVPPQIPPLSVRHRV